MCATEAITRYGYARGLRIMTYCDYYEECRQRRTVPQIAME